MFQRVSHAFHDLPNQYGCQVNTRAHRRIGHVLFVQSCATLLAMNLCWFIKFAIGISLTEIGHNGDKHDTSSPQRVYLAPSCLFKLLAW